MKVPSPAEMRKFLAATSGAVGEAVSLGLLTGSAEKYVTGGIAVLTAVAVVLIPNAKAAPAGEHEAV